MTISDSKNEPLDKTKMKVYEKDLQFARFMRKRHSMDIRMNRQLLSGKDDIPTLVYNGKMASLLIQSEPFFMSQKLYGIDPTYAISLDKELVMEYYRKYPDMSFFYRVNWESQARSFRGYTVDVSSQKEIFIIPMDTIKKLLNRGTPEHIRKNKTGEKISFIFDSREFEKVARRTI